MRKILSIFFLAITCCFAHPSFALLSMELTQGIAGALPISVVPFAQSGTVPEQNVSAIINHDLQNCGRFKLYSADALPSYPGNVSEVKFDFFRGLGVDNIVIGKVQSLGGDRYQVTFQLLDALRGKDQAVLVSQKYIVRHNELRALAHHISDVVYQKLTGIRGVFSTRIAYILVQRFSDDQSRYILEVADQDGYNPQPLLTSTDPIMSPAWSPNGKQIAYVSFEGLRSSIYIEDVATGARRLVSQFPGINGAPAWSPDGRKLALVLSKSGSPNIYVMDLASRKLTQYTKDNYINTEPTWSPDGRAIFFTSSRGGNSRPQIYQLNLTTRAISRVTYEGEYNARASFTPGSDRLVMLHRSSGLYNVGLLDLNAGTYNVLTNSGSNNESPSVAPNGSMVLFGREYNGKNILSMVSTDGRIEVRLPARDGDVQDPAWSPFLS